jgi:hypothetical protein
MSAHKIIICGNSRLIRQQNTELAIGALTSKVKQVTEILNLKKPTNYIVDFKRIGNSEKYAIIQLRILLSCPSRGYAALN